MSNTITSVQKDNLVVEPRIIEVGKVKEGKHQQDSVQHEDGICRTICTGHHASTPHLLKTIVSEPRIIKEGNYSPSGHNASSIVSTQGVAPAVMENHGTVTAIREPNVLTPKHTEYEETRVFETINKTNTREALCLLRSKVGEEAFQRQIGGLIGILKEEVLRQRMHEESLCSDRTDIARERTSSSLFTEDSILDTTEANGVRGMREDNEYRCPSQRPRLSKQFTNEFNTIVSQLPYEGAQTKECVSYLWRACKGSQSLQQTLDTMEEVWGSPAPTVEYIQTPKYRIRKLTVREVFRLMGVDDADIDKLMSAGISNSQLYKCAGNSIVVDTLYHLFRKLFVDKGCEKPSFQQTLF